MVLRDLVYNTVIIKNTKTALGNILDKKDIILEHIPEPVIGNRRRDLLLASLSWEVQMTKQTLNDYYKIFIKQD